jgi:cGMP-dependent protein kinase
MMKDSYFGERSVLLNEARSATVMASGEVSVLALRREVFLSIIDQSIRKQLSKRIELQDESITLSDISIVKVLGQGMFGNVYLAIHNTKKTMYALKSVHRSKIEAHKIHDSLVLERNILLQIDHSMIMKLVKTFKDHDRVYFLGEYVKGLDMFDAIRKIGLCTNE